MITRVKLFTTIPPFLIVSKNLLKYVKPFLYSGIEFFLDIGKQIAKLNGVPIRIKFH